MKKKNKEEDDTGIKERKQPESNPQGTTLIVDLVDRSFQPLIQFVTMVRKFTGICWAWRSASPRQSLRAICISDQ